MSLPTDGEDFNRFLPNAMADISEDNNNNSEGKLMQFLANMQASMTQNFAAVKSQINETNEELSGRIESLNARVDQVETIHHNFSSSEEEEGIEELINEAQGADTLDVSVDPTKEDAPDEDGSELLQQFIEQAEAEEQMDTDVDPRVATIVNKVFRKKIDKDAFKKLTTKIETSRPKNCEGLAQVTTNSMLWPSLSEHAKGNDRKLQNCQKGIVKAGAVVSKMLDSLVKIKGDASKLQVPSLLSMANDALSLIGSTNYAINMMRRDLIKPELKESYRRLCSDTIPFTTELFGDDLAKSAKEIGETAKLGNRVKGGATGGNFKAKSFTKDRYRSTPYQRGRYNGSSSSGYNNRDSAYNTRSQKNFPPRRGGKGKR